VISLPSQWHHDRGISPERASATLDALTNPVLYADLTDVHGWTPDDYQSWLTGILLRELLAIEP